MDASVKRDLARRELENPNPERPESENRERGGPESREADKRVAARSTPDWAGDFQISIDKAVQGSKSMVEWRESLRFTDFSALRYGG